MTLQEQIKAKEAELVELQKKATEEKLSEQKRIEAEKKAELELIKGQLKMVQERLDEFNKKYGEKYDITAGYYPLRDWYSIFR